MQQALSHAHLDQTSETDPGEFLTSETAANANANVGYVAKAKKRNIEPLNVL